MFSVIVHFKGEKEYHLENPSWYKTMVTVALCGLIFFKDIAYVVLYPHTGWISTYLLWMSIIAPFCYIHTRKSLGNYDKLMTACIYLGYDWKLAQSKLKARKRFLLVVVLAL